MQNEESQIDIQISESSIELIETSVSIVEVVVNILILYGLGGLSFFAIDYLGVVHRGFFCDDETIRYEKREETITDIQLIVYNVLLILITILTVELYSTFKENRFKSGWSELVERIFTYLWYSQIGFVINLLLNNTTKNSIGRLRPHFIDVCKPPNSTCTGSDFPRYITDYECSGSPELVLEARKSFYSGHFSISLYCAVWSALFVQARLSTQIKYRVLIPVLQSAMLAVGLLISFSRISDHKHHWSDVLVGIIVGSLIAVYSCVYWTDMIKTNRSFQIVSI